LIDQFRAEEPVDLLCSVFEVPRSCYYAHCRKRRSPDVKRLLLRSRVNELFTQSRSAAGSRSIMFMMREDGIEIGRFKIRKLMSEMKLISKQPGSHAYKKAAGERPDIPNALDRAFTVSAPNEVWCGGITYVWVQGRWHYVVAVIDMFARRVVGWAFSSKPDAEQVFKALDVAYEQRGRPQNVLFHSDQSSQYGSRSFRQRLWRYRFKQSMSRCGNCHANAANGTVVSQLENGMATECGLHERCARTAGYRTVSNATLQLATVTSIQWRAPACRGGRKT